MRSMTSSGASMGSAWPVPGTISTRQVGQRQRAHPLASAELLLQCGPAAEGRADQVCVLYAQGGEDVGEPAAHLLAGGDRLGLDRPAGLPEGIDRDDRAGLRQRLDVA